MVPGYIAPRMAVRDSAARALSRARALRIVPEALLGVDAPAARPVHMHLEHTTVCDHVCSTCVRADVLGIDGVEEHMPLDVAKAHIDAVSPRFLSLNGIGEPLMHPEWDVISRWAIEEHGASVGFATTGTFFRPQADRIVNSGVGLMKVSFHGAKPRTYSRLASGRDLEVVKDGIRAVVEAKAKAGRGPSVRMNYVVSEQSYEEMPEAVRVAAETGMEAIYFKGALVPKGRNSGLAGEHDIFKLRAMVFESDKLARELGVATNLDHWKADIRRVGNVPVEQRPPPPGRCLIPWISVFVRIDGTLLPCCNCTFIPDEGGMGRVGVDGTFEEVWRGEAFSAIRREMRGGEYSLKICRDCPDPVTIPQVGGMAMNKLWPGFLSS